MKMPTVIHLNIRIFDTDGSFDGVKGTLTPEVLTITKSWLSYDYTVYAFHDFKNPATQYQIQRKESSLRLSFWVNWVPTTFQQCNIICMERGFDLLNFQEGANGECFLEFEYQAPQPTEVSVG